MSKRPLVSLLLVLVVATSFLSSEVTALHSIAGGCAYLGGSENDEAYSIARTSDLGFVIAGYTNSSGEGGADFWLLKYGPTTMKDTLNRTITYAGYYWNKTYGGPEDEFAKCVIQTLDGGFALAGYTNSSASGLDVWLVKTDSTGVMEWNLAYGGIQDEVANSLIQTKDGGYLLAGCVVSGGQSKSTLVVKIDAMGNMEWNQTLPGQGSNSVAEDIGDGYALAVSYPNAFGLVKINATGFAQQNQTYVAPGDIAEARSIIQADDGGYAIAGWTQNNSTSAHGTWLVKTDSNGIAQWARDYEKLGAYSLIKTIDGNFAMTGDRACLIVTDSDGNLLMTKTYDGETGDGGKWFTRTYSLTETIANHFYMVGTHNSSYGVKLQLLLANSVLATDDTPPTITVLSPENDKTYPSDNIPLTFFVNKPSLFLWYSLDGQNATLSGNTTLPTLADGQHRLTVYARDISYNIGTSEPVLFSSETIYFTIDAALTIAPPDDTSSTDHNPTDSSIEQSQIILIAAAIITTAAIASATTIYYKKHKIKTPNNKTQ